MRNGSDLRIRAARAEERDGLEELQRRSSTHQPLYREELAAHPDSIELPAEQIAAGQVRVAERDGRVVGFAVLIDDELDGLFVEPSEMRSGIGRALLDDALQVARERGLDRIRVIANPQALGFYEAVGFVHTGETQTRFGPAPTMARDV